jgi:hypothetical protein
MKLRLMIEGSAAMLAAVLANLPDEAGISMGGFDPLTVQSGGTGAATDDDGEGPANPSAPALDSAGLPWDERIHAKTKATVADGTWRKRRNIDDATVAAVEAELRAQAPAPVTPAAPPPPIPPMAPPPVPMAPPMPVQPAPAAPPMPPVQPAPVAPVAAPLMPAAPVAPPPAPVAQPAPVASPEGTAPSGPTVMDFNAFMQHVAGQMAKKDANGHPLVHADVLTQYTTEIATAFKTPMTAFTDIMSDPQKINYAMQLFQRDGRW